jgi:hypothetical protein
MSASSTCLAVTSPYGDKSQGQEDYSHDGENED